LIGILANKGELWASDVRCMNDTHELYVGQETLRQAMKQRSAHSAHGLLSRLLEHPAYVSAVVFVTSFSAKRDLLSQWRAYADNGAGFAVGFHSAELGELKLDGKEPIKHLMTVEYKPSAQEARASRLIERLLEVLDSVSGQTLDHQDDQVLATTLGLILHAFAAASKNGGFAEEAERRLALLFSQDPLMPDNAIPGPTMPVCQFRAGRYGITPFVKLRLPDGALTPALSRIVIGPRAAVLDTEQKVRVLLANAGVQNWSKFPIERSEATYR
jgi:hypothetical protein